jgi:S-layer domain protein
MQRMKRSGSKLLCILLLLSLLLSLTACGKPETQLEKTAGYLQAQIAEPGTGSVGGDWLIFGLARSGVKVPQKYFDAYYENVEAAVREKNGVLSDRKYTEYSRTVLALTAIGKNPADVAGFDLLKPLADFEQVTRQGINGTIFALLALDSGNYEIPENPDAAVQATRQMYVDELLARALPDGGWTLTGGEPDVDITAMTLQALAKYRDQADVTAAVERGLAVLSSLQEPDGGYVSWGSSNSESVAQVIVALTELGVPLDDERFTKNGITVEDALLRFAQENGAFVHVRDGSGGDDGMATEQAFYALAAIHRAETGETTLYDMTDVMQ